MTQQRKSPRATFHNYSGGDYFITICTADMAHYFGEVAGDEMVLSEVGRYCRTQIEEINRHYPYADVILFVVMPNHLHMIIRIDGSDVTGMHGSSFGTHEPCVPTVRTLLGVVVGGLKRAVTVYARRNDIDFCWQGRYHDHIIRGVNDGNRIAEYIENNVGNWHKDCFYKR